MNTLLGPVPVSRHPFGTRRSIYEVISPTDPLLQYSSIGFRFPETPPRPSDISVQDPVSQYSSPQTKGTGPFFYECSSLSFPQFQFRRPTKRVRPSRSYTVYHQESRRGLGRTEEGARVSRQSSSTPRDGCRDVSLRSHRYERPSDLS